MIGSARQHASAGVKASSEGGRSWSEYLISHIDAGWRPNEFDFENLILTPDVTNPMTIDRLCSRTGCGVLVVGKNLCPSCRRQWLDASAAGTSRKEWEALPKLVRTTVGGCLVPNCQREHSALGLCHSHVQTYRMHTRNSDEAPCSTDAWIAERNLRALKAADACLVPGCEKDRIYKTGLCSLHQETYRRWQKSGAAVSRLSNPILHWIDQELEPPMPNGVSSYAAAGATPFMLLPDPLRTEFLYAVHKRDIEGGSLLSGVNVRGTYLELRRSNLTTLVGATKLGRKTGKNANLTGMLVDWQRIIDDAHRAWSGVDLRDQGFIYLRDVPLRKSNQRIGPQAKLDLRAIQHDWISKAIVLWAHSSAHGVQELRNMASTWQIASEVLTLRGVPTHALGSADMSAIVAAMHKRWPRDHTHAKRLTSIERLIHFARHTAELSEHWEKIPARFVLNRLLHLTGNSETEKTATSDEAYRYVPQPIVDWVMDHLHLLVRHSPYATAEARMMIYIQERCGRRTGETLRLEDDCISYDGQGAPYLEWVQGKPPFAPGKRLPIHQETHDVIREWQDFKRQHQVQSKWLFPSRRSVKVDRPYTTEFLANRFSELTLLVHDQAPYPTSVEGSEGNLIHFNLLNIDPYSFRHAFAQRLADATDESGRPTTTPDVLRELMGHKSFNTTQAYFRVTATRRKRAMDAIAPRRLNTRGEIVDVTRERDGFSKIAVTLGHCIEPQNVAAGGLACPLEHSCESCPFFLVDPLEQEGMKAKRHQIRVMLERALVIGSPEPLINHYVARIDACTKIIDGIDSYVDGLEDSESQIIRETWETMAELRRRSTATRKIDIREFFETASSIAS